MFRIFYSKLLIGDLILQSSTRNIESLFKNKNYIIKFDNSQEIANCNYYKKEKKQVEILVNKKRYTFQTTKITTIQDAKKANTASRANYVQAIDAKLARWYLTKQKGITIHDCFMIDYINTTFLISKINEGMRISFHDIETKNNINTDELYSIFIIL
jgi:hypothetical protein